MRVMLTGGTGLVGSHSARALLDAGHRVRLLARSAEKVERTFGAGTLGDDDVVLGDITDAGAVARALAGCDAVLHAAAIVALESHRADEVLRTNQRGVELVIGGAVERGIPRILYVSSSAAMFRPGGPPITADSPVAPAQSAYGRSKAVAEQYVRGLQAEGAPILTTYPGGVMGPDDPGLSEISNMLVAWLGKLGLVTTSGMNIVDARDLAQIHLRLLESAKAPGRYLAGGPFIAWPDFHRAMVELTGRPVRHVRLGGGVMRAIGRVGDVLKRIRDFDYPLDYESMSFATRWTPVDSRETEKATGVGFRDLHETFRDTLRSMYRQGLLGRETVGKLADDLP